MSRERRYRVIFGSGLGFASDEVTATDPVNAVGAAVNTLLLSGKSNRWELLEWIRLGMVRVKPLRSLRDDAEHDARQPG